MQINESVLNQYFDQVYVLNLEKRPDRKIGMLQKLSRLGVRAEFVQAVNGYSFQNKLEYQKYLEKLVGEEGSHPLEITQQRKLISSPGAWGYLKTYFAILQDAKKRGFKRILCFDDDVLFHKDFENQFNKAVQGIPEDWKLLYLGASQYVWKIPQGLNYSDKNKNYIDPNEPFYFPNNTDGSFALGLDISVFDLLIHDILKMNCPFDSGPLRTIINTFPDSCYVFNPNLVIADVSESDIREGQAQQELAEQLKWNMADYNYPLRQDLISVIMTAFNAERTIEKSIRSILMQSYQTLELIVVDDASSDNTTKIVEHLKKEDSRIQLISLSINKGVGGARNEGIIASKGKIIAFQDADDISLKDRLSYQLIPIYEKGMLFSVCRFYRSRCTIEELDINDQEATLSLVKSRRIKTKTGLFEYRDRADVGLVTALYKRCVFEEYGLFDMHRFGEDMELVERILFYKLNKYFGENYNGHTYLSEQDSVSNTFARLDIPLYISSDMTEDNLTIQYEKKRKERQSIHQKFRSKYRSGGLDQFPKLLVVPNQSFSTFKYNTLKIDSFVILPEFEHQILLNLMNEAIEANNSNPTINELHNSFSWKITAPLRWFGGVMQQVIRIFT